jgi:hypothetical protein
MEKLTKLVSLQNKQLLETIANKMIEDDEEKKIFIEKYNKYNYHKLRVSKNDDLLKYSYNRIINIQSAFNL